MGNDHELAQWVTRARTALDANPEGDLEAGFRRAVLGALGPAVPGSTAAGSPGHRRRALLAIGSARRALPAWDRARPGDDLPRRILAGAEDALRAPVAGKGPAELIGSFGHEVQDRFEDQDVSIDVAIAALYALQCVAVDFGDDPKTVDLDLTDADLDPDETDGHWYAAAASAGGSRWHPESSPEKRREFWRWWLDEAVPAAWREEIPE